MTMARSFGHEKLIVCQEETRRATSRGALLDGRTRRVAARDHLERGLKSILVIIAATLTALLKAATHE